MLCRRQTSERMFDGFLTSVRARDSDRNDPEPRMADGSQRHHRYYGRNCVATISSVWNDEIKKEEVEVPEPFPLNPDPLHPSVEEPRFSQPFAERAAPLFLSAWLAWLARDRALQAWLFLVWVFEPPWVDGETTGRER